MNSFLKVDEDDLYKCFKCCAFLTEHTKPYKTFVDFKRLQITKKQLEEWVHLIQENGFPIGDLEENNEVFYPVIPDESPSALNKSRCGRVRRWKADLQLLAERLKKGPLIVTACDRKKYHGGAKRDSYSPLYEGLEEALLKEVYPDILKGNEPCCLITVILYDKKPELENLDFIVPIYDLVFNDVPLLYALKKKIDNKKLVSGAIIKVDPTDFSSGYHLLAAHTLIRYSWMFPSMLSLFFKIKEAVKKIAFWEALTLANMIWRGDINSGFTLFSSRWTYFQPIEEVLTKLERRNYGIFDATSSHNRAFAIDESTVRTFEVNKDYLGLYRYIYKCSYGRDFNPIGIKVAIRDFGMLTEGKGYDIASSTKRAYKVLADDFCLRWYTKSRFRL